MRRIHIQRLENGLRIDSGWGWVNDFPEIIDCTADIGEDAYTKIELQICDGLKQGEVSTREGNFAWEISEGKE